MGSKSEARSDPGGDGHHQTAALDGAVRAIFLESILKLGCRELSRRPGRLFSRVR